MNFENLKPNDLLTVYHGTSLSNSYSFLYGFDATKEVARLYGGRRHRGLFVSPRFRTARSFASYGPIVLELVVRAKNLHGTDYSGYTGRDVPRNEEIWRKHYPNSFRPYLSATLSATSAEPQALLLGLVSPRQIKRVWYAPSNNEQGQWYTRKEFLNLGLETRSSPYDRSKKLKSFGVDVSYPNYGYEDLIEAIARLAKVSKERIEPALLRRLKISLLPDRSDTLTEFLTDVGFEPRAAKRYADRMRAHFKATDSAAYRLPFIKRRLSKMARKIKTLPQGRWVDITWESLSKLVKESVWEMYDLTFAKIGKHVPNLATFGQKYKFIYLVDLDDDIKPDAFLAYKNTHAGKKIALGGTDGSRKAKRAMITKMVELLRKGGWYVESSHRAAEILESYGFKPIDNELVVRETLKGKSIEWLGDGKYSRQLGSSSITSTKSLYGNPKVGGIRQASENVPTNPKLWAKVQKLTKGEVKSINVGGKEIVGPNDGKGFDIFPSAYCVPMDSEALTEKGWRKFEELEIGDRILAYDRVRDVLDWSPIQNLHFFPKAPTVRLKKQSLDVVCTPNHRWLHFRTSHLKSHPEGLRDIWSEIQAVQKGQKKVSHLIRGERPNFQHWWDNYQHCTTYDEFFLESGRGGASLVPTNQMSLEGKLLVTAPYVGGQDSDWKFQKKYRGSWIEDLLKMSPDALESFYAACVMCDGWDTQNKSDNHGFSQKDPDHADAFELCAFLTGRRVRRRFDPERGLSFFTTNRKRYIPLPGTKVLPESDQPVWCPETEFGTWVMRQNGHVMITGNSNGWASKTYKQLGGGWKKGKKASPSKVASLYFAASDPLSRIRSLIYDAPSVERDREILEIREDNPSLRRVIDDYLRGRFNPKYKATVYETVRSYDDPEDDTTDVIMEDEEYDSLDELLDAVQSYGWLEWSSSQPTSRDWIVSHPEENWRDGGTIENTLFIRRSDKNPLSKDDIRYISKELRLR